MTRRISARSSRGTERKTTLRALRALRSTCWSACLVLLACAFSDAQPAVRRATNLAALLAYPGFYHGRPVLIVGKVAVAQDGIKVSDDLASIRLVLSR